MRLCYIGPAGTVHTQRWLSFFARRGHEVHLLSTTLSEWRHEGIQVHSVPLGRSESSAINPLRAAARMPRTLARYRALLRELRPDILHVHYLNEAALMAAWTGFHPLVMTAWGSDVLIAPELSKLRKAALRRALGAADLVTCDAYHMERRLLALGTPASKTKVVFFGTDVDRFHPGARDGALQKRLSPKGGPVVISLRSLEPVYDLATLLKAVPAVLASRPDTRFALAGGGSLADPLRRLAQELGIEGSVDFLGLPAAELPGYLASSDVYVSTALSDAGLAASTAEAMACGVPPVVTEVAENAQWVEDGMTGRLFPPQDPRALADALMEILGDDGKRAALGRSARRTIVDRCNYQHEMARMESLYAGLMESHAAHQGASP
jgi:L-malate glycosyltransferase